MDELEKCLGLRIKHVLIVFEAKLFVLHVCGGCSAQFTTVFQRIYWETKCGGSLWMHRKHMKTRHRFNEYESQQYNSCIYLQMSILHMTWWNECINSRKEHTSNVVAALEAHEERKPRRTIQVENNDSQQGVPLCARCSVIHWSIHTVFHYNSI